MAIIACKALSFVLGSIVVSIPACHAGDRGSIPRRGEVFVKETFISLQLSQGNQSLTQSINE